MIALAIAFGRATPAFADTRIDELTKMLESSSEKTRLSAVVSLARLGDKRTLKPLVMALHDPAADVRAIAATALGHLRHKAALPALRSAANDDTDDAVRAKAREAEIAVAKANNLADELPQPATPAPAPVQARHTTGFGHSPHAVEDRPDLYVMVKSSSDDSPGKADKVTRKGHAELPASETLLDSFKTAQQVTMADRPTRSAGGDSIPRHIDLTSPS